MTNLEEGISAERAELLRNILEKPDLEYCHQTYPGAVTLELARRTRAVVVVTHSRLFVHLSENDHGCCALSVEGYQTFVSLIQKEHPALWRLILHVAAEAMLAVRNGHKEHVRTATVKRKAVQQKSMADTF